MSLPDGVPTQQVRPPLAPSSAPSSEHGAHVALFPGSAGVVVTIDEAQVCSIGRVIEQGRSKLTSWQVGSPTQHTRGHWSRTSR